MFKPFSKVVVLSLMLIAFIGQALAFSAMSCEMSMSSHQSHMKMDHAKMGHYQTMNHSDMNHSDMNHSEMNNTSNDQSQDCCEVDCVCPANACTSTTVLNSSVDSTVLQLLSEAVVLQPTKQPKSISSSLYRPPIFA